MNGDDQNAAASMEIERKIDKVLLQNSRESEEAMEISDEELCCEENSQLHHQVQESVEQETKLELRNYQRELTKLAEQGKNVIISAPPGSGKTIVACYVIKMFLERNPSQKAPVLLFTPGGALATQQCTRLNEHLPKKCKVELMCGSAGRSTFLETTKADVVVLTPQILLNELEKDKESRVFDGIGDFGLLIFDECHRCTKGHPYNGVMKKYFALKNDSGQSTALPQIIGLSATLGIGPTTDVKSAVKVMKLLCANLNAVDGIVSVKDHVEELKKFTPSPDEIMINLESMHENEFSSMIVGLMRGAKQTLDGITANDCPSFDGGDGINKHVLKQWCVNFKDVIAQHELIPDHTKAKVARTCIDFIELYLDVLDFYLRCRSLDALDHLEEGLDLVKLTKFDNYCQQEKTMHQAATSALTALRDLDDKGKFVNPNLKIIENLISKKFLWDESSKGMIMVEMRKYAYAFKKWLDCTESLRSLSAQVFTGTGNSTDDALTHQQQKDIMKDFRAGKHRLLICTPDSAGEGIDVTDCNLVIIYDIMTNEITIKQIKGRARKTGGEVYQLCSAKVARRDHLNKRKTELMEAARRKIEREIEEDLQRYQSELHRLQREEYLIERIKQAKPAVEKNEDEYIFKCKRCRVEVCSSRDIRLVESTQHICIRPDFEAKYKTELPRKKQKAWEHWAPKNLVLCDSCGEQWGTECEWKGVVTVALLGIKGFVLIRNSIGDKKIRTPKKWKDAPFVVTELTTDEMEKLFNGTT